MGLSLRAWIEKTVPKVKILWLLSKEKVSGTVVIKEGHTDCLLGAWNDFLLLIYLKKVKLLIFFPIANSSGKIHLIYWMTFEWTDKCLVNQKVLKCWPAE